MSARRFTTVIEAATGGGAAAQIPPDVTELLGGMKQMRVTGTLSMRQRVLSVHCGPMLLIIVIPAESDVMGAGLTSGVAPVHAARRQAESVSVQCGLSMAAWG